MQDDKDLASSPSDDQPVEETTEAAPEADETTEEPVKEEVETPSEEEESPEEDEPQGEPESEEKPQAEEKPKKGNRAQKRIRSLANENKRLREAVQSYGGQQPEAHTPAEAGQIVERADQIYQQTGELPEEISPEQYQHLVAIREGQAQAQTAQETAQLAQKVSQLERKIAVDERTSQVQSELQEVEREFPVFREGSDDFDEDFYDTSVKALEDGLKENPLMNVKKFLSTQATVYQQARSKAGESASATVAKQAATSALTPTGASKRQPKDDKSKSIEELEAEIAEEHGVHN